MNFLRFFFFCLFFSLEKTEKGRLNLYRLERRSAFSVFTAFAQLKDR